MLERRTFITLLVAALFIGVTAAAHALTPMEQLGKEIYFAKISEPNSQSCADCHAPDAGFTGPIAGINVHGAVYRGAVPQRFGNRKPPAASYATLSPIFHYDAGEGLFVGGNFWDGRATGEGLGNPAADQALGPFLNPVEQNNPSKQAVLEKIARSKFAKLWSAVWGEPISWATPAEIDLNYNRIGLAIAAFEGSSEVNQFSSKFDMFWANATAAGMAITDITMANRASYAGLGFSDAELEGLALFNDESKGKCALCHVLDSTTDASGNVIAPLLTDFTFDNLGTPKNPENPFYGMDQVYLDDGTPINPLGAAWIDPGLGGFLATHPDPDWQAMAAENWGKHKVPTLRNVDKRPLGKGSVVDKGFPKAYMHNGVFKSLKETVHFYNTRDVEPWPAPEVAENVNTEELGNLGLTPAEEDLIVLFMGTLSDGYSPPGKPAGASVAGVSSRLEIAGPNPFNPSTTIRYELAKTGTVRLDVFDVAGRNVATLVNGWKAAGEYRVEFNADHLATGIYFVRLATAERTFTAKAVLLK